MKKSDLKTDYFDNTLMPRLEEVAETKERWRKEVHKCERRVS